MKTEGKACYGFTAYGPIARLWGRRFLCEPAISSAGRVDRRLACAKQ